MGLLKKLYETHLQKAIAGPRGSNPGKLAVSERPTETRHLPEKIVWKSDSLYNNYFRRNGSPVTRPLVCIVMRPPSAQEHAKRAVIVSAQERSNQRLHVAAFLRSFCARVSTVLPSLPFKIM